MSSLKMTFSLASLVLLIAFVAMPVMADPNDADAETTDTHARTGHVHPGFTIEVFSDDAMGAPTVAATMDADGNPVVYITEMDKTTERNAFTLKYTFDAPVDPPSGVVTVSVADADGVTPQDVNNQNVSVGPGSIAAVLNAAGDDVPGQYMQVFTWSGGTAEDFAARKMVTQMLVKIPAALATGTGNSDFSNTAGIDTLAMNQMVTVGASVPKPEDPKAAATVTVATDTYHGGGRFMVTFTFEAADTPTFAEANIDVSANARILPGSFQSVESPPMDKLQWTAVIEVLLPDNTDPVTVTVKGTNVEAAATDGMVTVSATDTDTGGTPPADPNALSEMLPANGFGIISRAAVNGVTSLDATVTAIPDLQRFFAIRGTISLYSDDASVKKGDIAISEIMWGLNLAASTIDERDDHQWIELYNTTGAAIDLSKVDLVFTQSNVLPTDTNLVDQISNVELAGWTVDIGQSGRLETGADASPIDLISMYRNIDYAKVEKTDHDTADATKNRNAQLGGIPNGRAKGSWKASVVNDTFAINRLGSPLSKHFIGGSDYGATGVGRANVVITEVGNNGNYDWVELTAIADTNLENYELQLVKADKSIVVLAQFVKKELKAGEILLVVSSDPTNQPNHPIAAGKEWKAADADRENTGTQSLYHIDSRLDIDDSIGKTLFILRKEKGKTNHEHIVDLAGNNFIADTSAAYRTKLWPLRATGKGHGNVIDGAVEDFNDGRVYQRNDRGSGTGEKDWSVRGYTGVGYKRGAAANGRHGGTPGFDNDAVKDKASGLTAGAVTISEIMYATPGNSPQWIELYNSSKSQAINLNAWKLKIENDRDDDDVDIRTPSVTIEFGGVHIPPNQTVLIVSTTSGRNSGHFPSQRVIDLWSTEKSVLEVSDVGRQYQLLSTMSFMLTLTEKGAAATDTPADVVGNLGSDWELPMAEEGRSSIIRRYDAGVARDGTMPPPGDGGAWVLASESNLSHIREDTYYGRKDDVGTPGYRAGGALPVSLSKFRPERLDSGAVVIRWITESELNNAGFNILRSETRNGEFTKLNTNLIAGQGTISERTVYEFADTSAKPNVVYYYQIQDVSLDGQVQTLRTTHLRGNVTAAGKLTTTWGELKTLHE